MAVSASVRELFCRRLFRVGGATAALRHTWLDPFEDAATNIATGGNAVSATSSSGTSVQFQFFAKWDPNDAAELICAARVWADAADVAAALALIKRVRYVSPDFSGLRA